MPIDRLAAAVPCAVRGGCIGAAPCDRMGEVPCGDIGTVCHGRIDAVRRGHTGAVLVGRLDAARRRLLAAALLAAPLAWLSAARAADAPGRWPPLELRGPDGAPLLPVGGDGRATYVDFWASWCAPCRLSFPWMNEMQQRHADSGLRIVAINLDRREADARRFLAQHPPRFEIAFDPAGESARRLDIQAMPTSLLIGRDGTILWSHRGFRPEDTPTLERQLREALAQAAGQGAPR